LLNSFQAIIKKEGLERHEGMDPLSAIERVRDLAVDAAREPLLGEGIQLGSENRPKEEPSNPRGISLI